MAATPDPIDISIPLRFNGPQPNAYGVESATSEAVVAGDIIGDTRRGGSVNFERYTFIPQCVGTHTECVGHITRERIAVTDCIKDVLIPAVLISVTPENPPELCDGAASGDLVIGRDQVREAIELFSTRDASDDGFAMIVRTLPNDDSKLTRSYGEDNLPPYFSADAVSYLVEAGCKHLLTDLPSIDRIFDGGRLAAHRIFWNVPAGGSEIGEGTRMGSSITELIYVPNEVPDGRYILNLQIAPFVADAAPSRPLLLSWTSASFANVMPERA